LHGAVPPENVGREIRNVGRAISNVGRVEWNRIDVMEFIATHGSNDMMNGKRNSCGRAARDWLQFRHQLSKTHKATVVSLPPKNQTYPSNNKQLHVVVIVVVVVAHKKHKGQISQGGHPIVMMMQGGRAMCFPPIGAFGSCRSKKWIAHVWGLGKNYGKIQRAKPPIALQCAEVGRRRIEDYHTKLDDNALRTGMRNKMRDAPKKVDDDRAGTAASNKQPSSTGGTGVG
jgi:hypothetical protein